VTFQKSPLGLRNQRCYGVKASFLAFPILHALC
jgi:hypothetical protein